MLPGLHITQGLFTKLYLLFENACHQLDAKLALGYQGNCDNMSSNFVEYTKASHDLNKAKDDYEKATEMLTQLQQNATYFFIVVGQSNPIVQSLQELSKQTIVEVRQAVSCKLVKNAVNAHQVKRVHAIEKISRRL